MGVASLVLGIIAIVVACFAGVYSWVAVIIGAIGIVLAALAKKNGTDKLATAGLVCSIIGTAIALVIWIACLACYAAAASATNDLLSSLG